MLLNNNKVLALLPNAGLGNKLFVWAYALVFSKINSCPLHIMNWNSSNFISSLKGLNRFRWYLGSIKVDSTRKTLIIFLALIGFRKKFNILPYEETKLKRTLFIFNKIHLYPEQNNEPFRILYDYRSLLKSEFYNLISKRDKSKLFSMDFPSIAIHIRLGDFKHLGLATPLSYYMDIINVLNSSLNDTIEIKIFSDGNQDELKDLLKINNVSLITGNSAIIDLYLLAQSKILIISPFSTFSFWAGFFNEGILIRPKFMDNMKSIRPDFINEIKYEGHLSLNTKEWPNLLKNNLQLEFHDTFDLG